MKTHSLLGAALLASLTLALAYAFLCAAVAANSAWSPSDAALGLETKSFTAKSWGVVISSHSSPAFLAQSTRAIKSMDKRPVLIIGASQLHAINRPEKNAKLAVSVANECLEINESQSRLLQFSLPNANFQEFEHFLNNSVYPLEIKSLILAITYDDLREPGIRPSINLRDQPTLSNEHSDQLSSKTTPGNSTLLRDDVEKITVKALAKYLPYFSERQNFASRLRYEYKKTYYSIRARILEIILPPTTVLYPAPEPPHDVRASNEKALERIIQETKSRNIYLSIYWAPHPKYPGAFYHDRSQYLKYKNYLQQEAKDAGVAFYDFENLVPLEFWGRNNSGYLDVFHFNGEGHHRLGIELCNLIDGRSQ